MQLAGRTAERYGPVCGLDSEEAESLLNVELVEYADDYTILLNEQNIGIVVNRFKRVLRMYARADKIRRYAEECANRYEPGYVRLFLPFFYSRTDWASGPADGNGMKPGWRTSDAIDTALDIQRAYPRLKSWQTKVIECRYLTDPRDANGETDWNEIAKECGYVNAHSVQNAFSKATTQLALEMTGSRAERAVDHQGPGAREVVSNAQAHVMNQNN